MPVKSACVFRLHLFYTCYLLRNPKHALGIEAVSMPLFMHTIRLMFPIVQEMLDEVCELAKQEMKEVDGDELGSWTREVTVGDGVWHTRGWHSKNAMFSIRNYLTGALLYYMHTCQKGRDKIIKDELSKGMSKSTEGYTARVTFQKAKEEGMQIAVHWQDADSSGNAVRELFLDAHIIICGGHAGRAHRKILEKPAKMKAFPPKLIEAYRKVFPQVSRVTCHCKERHRPGCGCLSPEFIARAHTNFTYILMERRVC